MNDNNKLRQKKSAELKRERLEEDCQRITAEHEAVIQQLKTVIDGVIRVKLEGQAKEYERQIEEVEQQLNGLNLENSHPDNKIEIQVIVVAMTRTQAEGLCNRSTLTNDKVSPIQVKRVSAFLDIMNEYGGIHSDNYSDDPCDWIPNVFPGRSVSEIIKDVFKQASAQSHDGIRIDPVIISAGKYSEYIDDLAIQGVPTGDVEGIMVVDAISLYHPEILEIYSSLPIQSQNMAVLVIAPINYMDHQINHLVEQFICEHRFTSRRLSSPIDPLCEFSVGDLRSFNRWLFRFLREEISIFNNPQPSQQNRENMSSHGPHPSSGKRTSSLIFGSGQI